jgi:hypothetical protein
MSHPPVEGQEHLNGVTETTVNGQGLPVCKQARAELIPEKSELACLDRG